MRSVHVHGHTRLCAYTHHARMYSTRTRYALTHTGCTRTHTGDFRQCECTRIPDCFVCFAHGSPIPPVKARIRPVERFSARSGHYPSLNLPTIAPWAATGSLNGIAQNSQTANFAVLTLSQLYPIRKKPQPIRAGVSCACYVCATCVLELLSSRCRTALLACVP